VVKGGDYGWPECYFDPFQNKLVLRTNTVGDGGKEIGECANKLAPAACLSRYWARTMCAIYSGSQFFPKLTEGVAFMSRFTARGIARLPTERLQPGVPTGSPALKPPAISWCCRRLVRVPKKEPRHGRSSSFGC